MNIFISWSGENTTSHKVARALNDWLPFVINCLSPFISEDIQKGERGLSIIEEMLKDSDYGIVCVTKENYKAPWLLFEAGALSNNTKKIPVVPFLFGLTPSDLTGSPLIQFQATAHSGKESIKKLIQSLNSVCGDRRLSDSILDKSFEMWYPELDKSFSLINEELNINTDNSVKEVDKNRDILEEILENTRNYPKLLSNLIISDKSITDEIFRTILVNKEYKYEFSITYSINRINYITENIEINNTLFISDVLDMIYYIISDKVSIYTYLVSWILQEKNSAKKLAILEVVDLIPAYCVFKKDSIWEVLFLDKPFEPKTGINAYLGQESKSLNRKKKI